MNVPIGVILMIYESRPNVTVDAAALTLKTGNAIILRGLESINSNVVLHTIFYDMLKSTMCPQILCNLPERLIGISLRNSVINTST